MSFAELDVRGETKVYRKPQTLEGSTLASRSVAESTGFAHPQSVPTSEVPSSTREVNVELFRVFGCYGRSVYRVLGKCGHPDSIRFPMIPSLTP